MKTEMDSSPINQKAAVQDGLHTPCDTTYGKDLFPEITPDDDLQKAETTPSLHRPNKMLVADKSKSLKDKGQKLSKRKLFPGQSVGPTSGSESICGATEKRKKLEENVKRNSSDTRTTTSCPAKLPLTERQQLAFLLEVTSAQTSSDRFDKEGSKEEFTKIRPRKGKKSKTSAVNPRVYRRNERGETPLHIAAIKGDVIGIKKLIKEGAEVGIKDYAGWTALHEACNHGNLAAAKVLLKHGASVNVPGFEGDTPLHDAVMNNHVEVADMLLSLGANPRQPNKKGENPSDCVYTKEMCEIFSSHGFLVPATHKFDNQLSTLHKPNRHCDTSAIPESTKGEPMEGLSEQCNKGSILGNEIQRKQTQGESKMEKPVMYICKFTSGECDKEITVRTTQVTQAFQEEPKGVKGELADELTLDEGTETKVPVGFSEVESFPLDCIERAKQLPKCNPSKVTGDTPAAGEEDSSEKETSDAMSVMTELPESKESFVGQQRKNPLPENSTVDVINEWEDIPPEELRSGPTQAVAQLSFKSGPFMHQEGDISLLKESEDGVINVLEKEEREVSVNSEQSEWDTKESETDVEREVSRSANPSLENAHLSRESAPSDVNNSCKNGASSDNKVCRKTGSTCVVGDERQISITSKIYQETRGVRSEVSTIENKAKKTNQEAWSQQEIRLNDCPNQTESDQFVEIRKAVHFGHQSQAQRFREKSNKESGRLPSRCPTTASTLRRPPITWRSLMTENRCSLSKLRIPYYDQFLINTKDYELSNGAVNRSLSQTTRVVPLPSNNEKEELFFKQERAKDQLRRKQKSEEAKLQICMEQDIVRYHAKSAYSSLKCNPPPGVCAALCWQSMGPQQLKIEKKKLSQRRFLESTKVSQTSYQEIINKYDKVKKLMCVRHKHEQQALDAMGKHLQ